MKLEKATVRKEGAVIVVDSGYNMQKYSRLILLHENDLKEIEAAISNYFRNKK